MSELENILIIAHRGANKLAPENTLKAFQIAIDLKADYIEFDVHQSKDGEIVIMHDASVFRTTGHKGVIDKMTLKELKELDCGEGEQIPTLQELIDIAKGKIGLQCEVKTRGFSYKLVKLLKESNMIESTLVSSFNHDTLLEIRKLEPGLKIGALEPRGTRWATSWIYNKGIIKNSIKNKFSYIHSIHLLITKKFIDYAHRNNIQVIAWTVDSKARMKKLIGMGIDGLITNDIETAKQVLNRS